MKLFIAAILCLALLVGLCVFGTLVSLRSIGQMLGVLEDTPDDGANIPPEASAAAEKIKEIWKESEFVISLVHPHGHLDEVEEKIVDLCSFADADDYAAWHSAGKSLCAALDHLHDLLTANLDNVM